MQKTSQRENFDTKRPLYRIPMTIYRILAVGLLWTLCSLPLVTVGASTCAALGEFTDPENQEPHSLTKNFFRRFRHSFAPATVLWAAAVILAALLILDILFYRQFFQTGYTLAWQIVITILFILFDLLIGVLRFSFYEIAAAADKINGRTALRKGARLAFFCYPALAGMMLIDIFLAVFFLSAPYFVFLLPAVPGLLSMIHCSMIRGSLLRYEKKPQKKKELSGE